jgi:hypothetical protein
MKKNIGYALICFYQASTGGHGSAEVSNSLYECLPKKNRKLFEIKKKKIFSYLESCKFNYLENIYKFFYVFIIVNQLKKFIKKYKKKIIIIEGASWIGYTYLFFKIIRIILPNILIIYHGHNIEYDVRKKRNSYIVSYITKIIERYIYKQINFSTAVSKEDQQRLRKLYNVNAYIFPNGINKKRLLLKKPKFNLPEKYIIYSGSYSYKFNKIIIDRIIYKILPKILRKFKDIKLIITGKDFPNKKFAKYKFVKSYKDLDKKELNYLIKESLFMFTPMSKSPGTKLKVIETLLLGGNLITSKDGIEGVKFIKSKNLFIYSNINQMYEYIYHLIRNQKKIKRSKINTVNKFYSENYSMENILKHFFTKIKLFKNVQIS